jgi:hypothetical protein
LEIERLKVQVDESLANERRVYQMGVNVEMQLRHGFVPFPDAPHIPDSLDRRGVPSRIEPDYVDMRDVVAKELAEFHRSGQEHFGTRQC